MSFISKVAKTRRFNSSFSNGDILFSISPEAKITAFASSKTFSSSACPLKSFSQKEADSGAASRTYLIKSSSFKKSSTLLYTFLVFTLQSFFTMTHNTQKLYSPENLKYYPTNSLNFVIPLCIKFRTD